MTHRGWETRPRGNAVQRTLNQAIMWTEPFRRSEIPGVIWAFFGRFARWVRLIP
jgi:hypothetical protein